MLFHQHAVPIDNKIFGLNHAHVVPAERPSGNRCGGWRGGGGGERRGVMVTMEKNGRFYPFPLSEIEPTKKTGNTAAWIAAYKLWSK